MKKPLCRDIVGHQVRLLRDISTRGGAKFPKGTVMNATGHWRGRFDLQIPDADWPAFPDGRHISKVDRSSFEVLP